MFFEKKNVSETPAPAPAAAGPEVTYVFPALEGPGVMYIDPKTHIAWIGLNLKKTDYLESQAILDDSKYKILSYYRSREASKLLKPGKIGIKDMISNITSRFTNRASK